ncbi:MAG: hypothetical protein IKY54_00325 [Muribaculaceae bacterium]|nr:hypothetical protein [Muribaculaceae bacterium]
MIVITTIFWIIVGIIALYITIFVVAFIYNGYLLASGKMSKEELNYKVQLDKEKQKREKTKKLMEKKRKKANRSYDTLPWKLVTGRFP